MFYLTDNVAVAKYVTDIHDEEDDTTTYIRVNSFRL